MPNASDYSDIFVSYRRVDVEFVKLLVDELRKRGKEVWIDWEDIAPGSVGFFDDIKRGLDGADTFLCVLSPDYLDSPYCVDLELGYAVKNNKKLIPIVLKKFDGKPIPEGIGHINWIYFTPHAGQMNTFEESFERIIEAMETDLDHIRKHKNYLLRALEWDENNRLPAFFLNGEEIDAAEKWLFDAAGKDPIPTDLHKEYVTLSRDTEKKIQQRLRIITIAGFIMMAVLALAAAGFGFDANNQRKIADAARDAAELAREQAEQLAAQVQALFLSDNARTAQQEGDPVLALALIEQAIEHLDTPTTELENDYANLIYQPGPRMGINVTSGGQTTQLLVSSNQRYVVTASCDSAGDTCTNPRLTLWNPETWEMAYEFADITGRITALAFDRKNELLAVAMCAAIDDVQRCELGTTINIYNLPDGQLQNTWSGQDLRIATMVFNHTGDQLATGSWNNTITIWDANTGEWLHTLEGHEGLVSGLAYTKEDNNLLSIGCDANCNAGDLFVWDTDSGELVNQYAGVAVGESPLAIADSHNIAIFGGGEGALIMWNIARGRVEQSVRQHPNQINIIWLDETERQLVTGSLSRTLIIWETTPDGVYAPYLNFAVANTDVVGAGIVNDGQQFVTGLSSEPGLMVWDMLNGAIENDYADFRSSIEAMAVNPDATQIAIADVEDVISILDFETGEIQQQWETDQTFVRDIAYSPDGAYIATAECNEIPEDNLADCNEGRIRIRNSSDGIIWKDLVGHDKQTSYLVYSSDGAYLISMGLDETVIVWDIANGKALYTPDFSEVEVKQVGFLPDNSAYFVVTDDAVSIWSMADGSEISRITARDAALANVGILSNATQIALVDEVGHVSIHDLATGEQLSRTLVTATNNPTLLASGDYIFASERDEVIVMDLSGNIIRQYHNSRRVTDISAVGTNMLLVAHDSGLILWRIDTLEDLRAWANSNRYITELTCDEASNYLINNNCDSSENSE